MRLPAEKPALPPSAAIGRTRRAREIMLDWGALVLTYGAMSAACAPGARAAQLTVELKTSRDVTFVGAVQRWNRQGEALRPVDPRAKFETPSVSAAADRRDGNRWVFENLAPGRYDLVILADYGIRVEGFGFPPVLEFDPFMPHTAEPPKAGRQWVINDIAQSRHYENKVTPLYLAGDDRQIRVLVQLLRDKPTSYDAQFGEPVATIRHEIWQYTYRYGGWSKEKKTKVLDRILTGKRQLRRWTWIWTPRLGEIEVADDAVTMSFELPDKYDARSARGLLPY